MTRAPSDFPRSIRASAIAGTQPKLNLQEKDGHYVQVQPSEEEIDNRYEMCADLVDQLVTYCHRKKQPTETWQELLVEVNEAVKRKQWGLSLEEISWITKKLALQLPNS